jgi:hypothetical protein
MNTINSTIYGKAYEYACVLAFLNIVSKYRDVEVIKNESLLIAKKRYEQDISEQDRIEMLQSAKVGIRVVLDMEPCILEDGKDVLSVILQPDSIAKKTGDIRDVLLVRRSVQWEIGISVKHNHAALKHSRLSSNIDFGNLWMKTPCSKWYFNEIKPIFLRLEQLKRERRLWVDLENKEEDFYIPILKAFKKEFIRLNSKFFVCEELVRYLIGSNGKDYYKMIHNNNSTITIIPFNIFGTLNRSAKLNKPKIKVPKFKLPTRIIELEFKENSKTTLILTMNNGWSISFRIHNASSRIEPSLKFDIQLISKPESIFYINRRW